jgi:hypothetical protein
MPRLAILTVTALLMLAGCTSSDGSSGGDGKNSAKPKPTAARTTAPPAGPNCADIWKAGATLPEGYTKCVAGGAYGQQDVTECQDGTKLVAYADAYFAVTGGRISKPAVAPMQDTEEFGKAYAACTGE